METRRSSTNLVLRTSFLCVLFLLAVDFERWDHKMCLACNLRDDAKPPNIGDLSSDWVALCTFLCSAWFWRMTFVNIPFWFFDQDKKKTSSFLLAFGEQVGQSPPLILLFRLLFFLPDSNRLITFLSLSYSILVVSLISFSLSLPSFSSSYLSSVGSWDFILFFFEFSNG